MHLRQGYLDGDCRIRQSVSMGAFIVTRNWFTYKTKVNGKQIEIETEISTQDFDALWTKVAKIVTKKRVVVPTYQYTWEIDFFTQAQKDGYYLVMAEVELPEDVVKPDLLPEFISATLIHEVALNDKRFNSKQLSKPATVAALITDIRNGSLVQPA